MSELCAEQVDPKGLIRESFRIEGISAQECRSIFLDWALSCPAGIDMRTAVSLLLARYEPASGDTPHPMLDLLREAASGAEARPKRRGGWRSKRNRF